MGLHTEPAGVTIPDKGLLKTKEHPDPDQDLLKNRTSTSRPDQDILKTRELPDLDQNSSGPDSTRI